jgi:CBS-domain-containing membrane protein
MAPIKTSLYTDEMAGVVIDFMVEKHMGLVPVIERDGKFAGLISGDSLLEYMLPKSLAAMTPSTNLGYLDETAEEMLDRLDNIRHLPIGDLLDKDVEIARPDTPLIDALMLIKNKQYVVPVVDEDDMLIGAISFFSVLYALNESYDRDEVQKAKELEREQRKRDKNQ